MARGQSSKGAAKRMLYEPTEEKAAIIYETKEPNPTQTPIADIPVKINNTPPITNTKEKLKQKTVYLTDNQIKAIKLKTIESDLLEHKDDSAVIRAAIDAYLNL